MGERELSEPVVLNDDDLVVVLQQKVNAFRIPLLVLHALLATYGEGAHFQRLPPRLGAEHILQGVNEQPRKSMRGFRVEEIGVNVGPMVLEVFDTHDVQQRFLPRAFLRQVVEMLQPIRQLFQLGMRN